MYENLGVGDRGGGHRARAGHTFSALADVGAYRASREILR